MIELAPYPPFKEPDDWREAEPRDQVPDRIAIKATMLARDANADHALKHKQHEHPWCATCAHRFRNFEAIAEGITPHSPATAAKIARSSMYIGLDETQWKILRRCEEEAAFLSEVLQLDAMATAYPVDIETAYQWLDDNHRWESDRVEAETSAFRRAIRYLIVHGRQPVDDFDPEATQTSLLNELLDRDQLDELPEPDPLIGGVLDRHSYALLTGRDHTYKTFVALDWALSLATGRTWQGRHCERVRVLYMAGEGAYGLKSRVDAWEAAWRVKVDPEWFQVLPRAVDLYRANELDEFLDLVTDKGLVVVDTLRRVSGRADGNGSDMGAVVDNLDRIRRATDNGTVLALAHTDKNDTDSRGFSGIEDDADIVWHSKRDEGGRFTLSNRKMKNGPDGEKIALLASASNGSLIIEGTVGNAPSADTTTSQAVILAALSTTFLHTDGATASELMAVTGLAKSTFYYARAELLSNGQVESNGRGVATRYRIPGSNGVQPSSEHKVQPSPTEFKAPSPVQSSPTPFKGLDVGLGRLDSDEAAS